MIHNVSRLGRCATSSRWTGAVPPLLTLRCHPALPQGKILALTRSSTQISSKAIARTYTTGPEPRDHRRSNAIASRIFLWGAVVAFFGLNICSLHQITGQSMSPAINPMSQHFNDVVILNRYAASTRHYFWNVRIPKKQDLKIGDIVVMYSPLDPRLKITKRILALPGDIVFKKRSDQFDSTTKSSNEEENTLRMRIPPGHMWVEGDASANEYIEDDTSSKMINVPSNIKSRDSRQFGPVPMALVIGRVDYIVFPFDRFGPIPGRPGFDANRANEKRHARERNMMIPRDLQLRRAHPDDSTISPYSDWEWVTGDSDSEKKKGRAQRKRVNEREEKHRRSKSRRDDDMESIWKDKLNRMSRGGQLGRYVDGEEEND